MKRMTGFVVCLVLLMGSLAYAEAVDQSFSHGSTVTPGILVWKHNTAVNRAMTTLYLSNITEKEIECTVRFINHDGGESNQLIKVYSGNMNGTSAPLVSDTNVFKIPAYSSRYVNIDSSTGINVFGYANVSWKCEDEKITKAMVGSIRKYTNDSSQFSVAEFVLNNGQPF